MADPVEMGCEPCALFDHDMVVGADADMAVVRIRGKGKTAVYVGLSAEAAMRIASAFIRAGLRINPALRAQVIETALEPAPTVKEGA